jgi:hypothetical protein
MSWTPKVSLNRKSANGSRALSRVPREHSTAWSTTPPIAQQESTMESPTTNEMRRILRGMVAVMSGAQGLQMQPAGLAELDDARLCALAQAALENFGRMKTTFDGVEGDIRRVKKELEEMRLADSNAERLLAEAKKAVDERDDLARKYKALQKEVDPERRQLEIMYAIDEATKALKDEAAGLRRDLAQRGSEVESLRATKRKLREAIDRLAGKD